MTKNSRLAGSAGGDDDFEFSWKIFTAWDFMIANPETADNKVASIATVVRESIVDEQESSGWKNFDFIRTSPEFYSDMTSV